MNLETLHLYCEIVRVHSFSRGAAENGVSQSAASQAIQQLESEYDRVQSSEEPETPLSISPDVDKFLREMSKRLEENPDVG